MSIVLCEAATMLLLLLLLLLSLLLLLLSLSLSLLLLLLLFFLSSAELNELKVSKLCTRLRRQLFTATGSRPVLQKAHFGAFLPGARR